MTSKDFDALFEETVSEMKLILCQKGKDYSSEEDRNSNFKEIAELIGITPQQVWSVYFMKHVISVMNFVKKGVLHSEPIEGRILDSLNYLVLFRSLVKEKKESKSE